MFYICIEFKIKKKMKISKGSALIIVGICLFAIGMLIINEIFVLGVVGCSLGGGCIGGGVGKIINEK